jgi:hypothetical protein
VTRALDPEFQAEAEEASRDIEIERDERIASSSRICGTISRP